MLTHLQSDQVPLLRLECLRDLRRMYETVTVADVYAAYNEFKFDDGSVFTCIGTSGPTPIEIAPLQPAAAAGAGPQQIDAVSCGGVTR